MSGILVGLKVSDAALERIRAAAGEMRVDYIPELSRRSKMTDEIRAGAVEVVKEAEIIFATAGVDTDLLMQADKLKWLQVTSADVDRLVRSGLVGRGFDITTVQGMTSDSIGEWVLGVIVMFSKSLHRAVRNQAIAKWDACIEDELTGKTCGIVGYGAIGHGVAQRAKVFGMDVVATRRQADLATEEDGVTVLPHGELPNLLARSDYVVLSVPLTDETREMIGAREFGEMKESAVLINVARGTIVDQPAMIDALEQGVLAGARLDVTTPEPLPAESPLWRMENVILTPHISADVDDYWERATGVFLDNLDRFSRDAQMTNMVSETRAY